MRRKEIEQQMDRNDISDDVATLGITFDYNGNIIKVKDRVKIDE